MARKPWNKANYEREKLCSEHIEKRFDLHNVNWCNNKYLEEWLILDKIRERISNLMRFDCFIWINEQPVNNADFWEVVKNIDYSPAYVGIYKRYRHIEGARYPFPKVVRDDLLNAIYNKVNREMEKNKDREPRHKFYTDDLILSKSEKKWYEGLKRERAQNKKHHQRRKA